MSDFYTPVDAQSSCRIPLAALASMNQTVARVLKYAVDALSDLLSGFLAAVECALGTVKTPFRRIGLREAGTGSSVVDLN